ncbi:MAG: SRPBCC family protein, partial [Myxococcota bacterium]
MITVAMSKVIRSPRARVWRALVSPSELIRWDERRISLEAPIPDYPALGHPARWRCLLGSVTVEHCEDPLEVIPAERLRSAVRLASFEFEEIYTLADQPPDSTRLSLRLTAKNTLPLLGGELDRFDVRRLSAERVDQTLAQLQR